jgi:hypothetical protein
MFLGKINIKKNRTKNRILHCNNFSRVSFNKLYMNITNNYSYKLLTPPGKYKTDYIMLELRTVNPTP